MRSIKDIDFPDRKAKWRRIVFGIDTVEGRRFDVWLLIAILLSVLVVIIGSVTSFYERNSAWLEIAEWIFTGIFTVEYALRIYLSKNKKKFIFSFWGIIDLLSTLPAYLGLFFVGPKNMLIIRILRLLRVFRIFRLNTYSNQAKSLGKALKSSGVKIIVFFAFILIIVIIMGTVMFLVEGGFNDDFSSIPQGIYWAIVTITTVGYGDITPVTAIGQILSSVLMLVGYAIITVPTGIVGVEYAQQINDNKKPHCFHCDAAVYDSDANYCSNCGENLEKDS